MAHISNLALLMKEPVGHLIRHKATQTIIYVVVETAAKVILWESFFSSCLCINNHGSNKAPGYLDRKILVSGVLRSTLNNQRRISTETDRQVNRVTATITGEIFVKQQYPHAKGAETNANCSRHFIEVRKKEM